MPEVGKFWGAGCKARRKRLDYWLGLLLLLLVLAQAVTEQPFHT
jgi:hypothetical protein